MTIRTATPSDAAQLLAIYAPYVEQTAVSFEYDVPSMDDFTSRITHTLEKYPYLVAEADGIILGYAYAGPLKERAAYDWCVETSIYVRSDAQGRGVGTALYAELEKRLAEKGIRNLYACIAWVDSPSPYLTHQSPEFHVRRGFHKCAHFTRCGLKFGQWFDMIWMEKIIA